jgi:hypothetical protein
MKCAEEITGANCLRPFMTDAQIASIKTDIARIIDRNYGQTVEFVLAVADMTSGNGRIDEGSCIAPGKTIKRRAWELAKELAKELSA